jgi:hypothetical protein
MVKEIVPGGAVWGMVLVVAEAEGAAEVEPAEENRSDKLI